jgi:hypothetical protein
MFLYLALAILVLFLIFGLPNRATLKQAARATQNPAVRYGLIVLAMASLRSLFPLLGRLLGALRFFR